MKHLGSEVSPRHSYDHLLYLKADGKNEWNIRARKMKFGKNADNKIANSVLYIKH
jgi:hypothetical protein